MFQTTRFLLKEWNKTKKTDCRLLMLLFPYSVCVWSVCVCGEHHKSLKNLFNLWNIFYFFQCHRDFQQIMSWFILLQSPFTFIKKSSPDSLQNSFFLCPYIFDGMRGSTVCKWIKSKRISDLTTFGGSYTVTWLKVIYLAHECVPLLRPLSPQSSPLSVGDEKHYIFH